MVHHTDQTSTLYTAKAVDVTCLSRHVEKASKLSLNQNGCIDISSKRQAIQPGIQTRNETRARQSVREIIKATGNQQVRYEVVDVSRQVSIQTLVERWQGPLDVLVNNAAITPRSHQETPEGIELQFATNVLGYFWMTQALAGTDANGFCC